MNYQGDAERLWNLMETQAVLGVSKPHQEQSYTSGGAEGGIWETFCCWQKGEKQTKQCVGEVFSWRAVSEKATLGCFALEKGNMALQNDGGAKEEKWEALSYFSRRKKGSGCLRHGYGVMWAPSVVSQVRGSAAVQGWGECHKSLAVLVMHCLGIPKPVQCKLKTLGLDQGSPSLESCPGGSEPWVSTRVWAKALVSEQILTVGSLKPCHQLWDNHIILCKHTPSQWITHLRL